MADKKEAEPTEGAEGAEGKPAKKKLAGKTLILFIVLPAILLLGGGGAAAYFLIFAKKPAAEDCAPKDAKGHAAKDEHGEAPAADAHGEATAADAHGEAAADEHGKEAKKDAHGKDVKCPEAKDEKKDAHGKKEEKKGGHGGGHGGGGEAKEGDIKTSTGPNGEEFLTLPDILVNITTADQKTVYLKLRLTLQVKDAEIAEAIKPALPRIKDQYTGFLRELRVEDITGSAGYSRLQLELLKRVNLAVAPAQIDAVLIEEMLVQ